jgi:fatty acid synthase subunit beta
LASLLYIKVRSTWIDVSYKSLFVNFFHRVEERLSTKKIASIISSAGELSDPNLALNRLVSTYPASTQALLRSQDVQYFLNLCKTKGQKPVPFVPRVDEDLEYWMKKDSLWQSENLWAVVDQDVGRTCILHGPVAAKFSTTINQPIQEILDGIKEAHVRSIIQDTYSGLLDAVPVGEHLAPATAPTLDQEDPEHISVEITADKITYTITSSESEPLPSADAWFK